PESSRMIITLGFTSPLVPDASGLSARSTVAAQAIGMAANPRAMRRIDLSTTAPGSESDGCLHETFGIARADDTGGDAVVLLGRAGKRHLPVRGAALGAAGDARRCCVGGAEDAGLVRRAFAVAHAV